MKTNRSDVRSASSAAVAARAAFGAARTAAILVLSATLLAATAAMSAEPKILRIGTGGIAGVYHPIGTLIATSLSDGTIPGLLAVAQTSNGSVANVDALTGGFVELALAQANVVDLAHRGRLADRPAMPDLRAIANVYVEAVHLVAARESRIHSPADLQGRHVSLDEPGSGTLGDARAVLWAYGLDEASVSPEYIKSDLALVRLTEGRLDAFFVTAGTPIPGLARAGSAIRLVPVDGPPAQRLMANHPTYQRVVIEEGTYPGQAAVETVGVGAQLVTRADLDEQTVYEVTRQFWSDRTRGLLEAGHPKGRDIRLEWALDGLTIPLHPGAERFYREAGVLK